MGSLPRGSSKGLFVWRESTEKVSASDLCGGESCMGCYSIAGLKIPPRFC